jgi:hypothetical protein
MSKPLVLIFGEKEEEMQAFGETVKAGHTLGFRFPGQLFKNHIEDAKTVYMMKDYPAVREAYGEKAVLVDTKTASENGSKSESKTGTK